MLNLVMRMGGMRQGHVRGVGGALLTLFCILGCDGNSNSDTQSGNTSGNGGTTSNQQSSDPTKRFDGVEWDCTQSDSVCTCYGIPPNVDAASSGSYGLGIVDVLECGSGYACCLNMLTSDGTYNCSCSSLANCQAEAASRQNTEVVATCPPVPRTTNCAKVAENCRSGYLSQMGYDGCCSGLSCVTGSDGVPTCQ
jgi:hypothetical protein